MGWNTGYTIFESTVIGAYNLGVLDKKLLAVLMEPYRGTDIDEGGCCDLKSKDGLGVEEVVLKVCGKKLPPKPDGFDLPHRKQTEDQQNAAEEWYDKRSELFGQITQKHGW